MTCHRCKSGRHESAGSVTNTRTLERFDIYRCRDCGAAWMISQMTGSRADADEQLSAALTMIEDLNKRMDEEMSQGRPDGPLSDATIEDFLK